MEAVQLKIRLLLVTLLGLTLEGAEGGVWSTEPPAGDLLHASNASAKKANR